MMLIAFEELGEKINEIMDESMSLATGVRAWMLLSREGLPITSSISEVMGEAETAAMAASLLSVADMAAERMGQGSLEELLLTNENGLIILKSVGDKAILILAAAKDMKTGLLVYTAKTGCDKIALLL